MGSACADAERRFGDVMMGYDVSGIATARGNAAVDSGLRAFLLSVYQKVAGGLLVSAAVAWGVADFPAVRSIFFTTAHGHVVGMTFWGMALSFSPLLVIAASFAMRDRSGRGAGWLYWTVVVLVGGSMSVLVLTYTGAALVSTFLITAGAFGGLSLWGYTTRRDLTAIGSFLTVALFGLILAILTNLFFKSSGVSLALELAGVLIFGGLIASDTQRLKIIYYQSADGQLEASSNYGALTLYLNFINLFDLLLGLSGGQRR
jgi:uncharacterized protein